MAAAAPERTRPPRPTRLAAMGIGCDNRIPARIGQAYQCSHFPSYLGPVDTSASSDGRDPLLLPPAELEREVATGLSKRLTAAAFEQLPPHAAASLATAHALAHDDELVMRDLVESGALVGAGRSSYIAELHGAMSARRRAPGMLACEMGKPKGKPPPPQHQQLHHQQGSSSCDGDGDDAGKTSKGPKAPMRRKGEGQFDALVRYVVECGARPCPQHTLALPTASRRVAVAAACRGTQTRVSALLAPRRRGEHARWVRGAHRGPEAGEHGRHQRYLLVLSQRQEVPFAC
jgi:hypothetical protein